VDYDEGTCSTYDQGSPLSVSVHTCAASEPRAALASRLGLADSSRYDAAMPEHRTRWSIEEIADSFIVRDATGRVLGQFHFYNKPDRLAPNHLTRDEAKSRAANFAKLPGLLRKRRKQIL